MDRKRSPIITSVVLNWHSLRSASMCGVAWVRIHTRACLWLVGLTVLAAAPQVARATTYPAGWAPGDPVDLVLFGTRITGDGFIGVEWDNPRDIREVRVVFPHGERTIPAEAFKIEWWGSVWPDNGTGGWMKLDDPWNGEWVRAEVSGEPASQPASDMAAWVFRFSPLTKKEWKRALESNQYPDKQAPTFRRTLKLRVRNEAGAWPSDVMLAVLGGSRLASNDFRIEFRLPPSGELSGSINLVNGTMIGLLHESRGTAILDWNKWTLRGEPNTPAAFVLRLEYAENKDPNSNDLTRVTVRIGTDPRATGFSFVPQDVLKEADRTMRLPDFKALVTAAASSITLANDPGPQRSWKATVRRRIPERPETSLASAMAGIPRLKPARWVPLGVPSARQEIVVGPLGDWSMWRESLWTDGRDRQRSPFRSTKGNLDALLNTRPDPRFKGEDREGALRYLEEDHLPLIHVEWRTGPIQYRHALAATILLGDVGDDDTRRGDETVVLLTRLEATNTSGDRQTATVNLRYSHDAPISLKEDGIIAIEPPPSVVPAGLTAVRGQLAAAGADRRPIEGWTVLPPVGKGAPSVLRWQASLAPGETRTLYFKQPYVDLLDAAEFARLKEIRFDREVPKMLDYWRKRLAADAVIDVPEPALNHFYAANLWHNVITADRDPKTGLYNEGVGTFAYRVFANETVMIARSMDMRGEHKDAERYLEPMLYYQGSEPLKGRFSTKEGALHGAGEYTHGEYAMNHGFVLWGVADHYFMTRDRAYLERVAPKLVKGCDFLISERKSTMGPEGKPRPPMHGLAPASSLEDVVEYQYWFATNGFFYLGMKRAAQALADIGHPEAKRIAQEAEAYRRDIEVAVREATTKAAAVRLRDGMYIPYVPSRVFHWRHLTEGWIREALYPSLDLATAEVISPDDPLITWMLDELEDNIFFSAESGYGVPDVDKNWFELGGVTLQPCLVDTPFLYMARNEIPAALRSFYNTYALSIYPDVNCFAEWAKRFGVGGGPVYKTSDESRFVMWLRQFLVWENGNRLWLGRAVPRQWLENGKTVRVERAATVFGPMSMTIRSEVDHGRIHATVTLPRRNPPAETWLRLRHPTGKTPARVLVGGTPVAPERVVGEDIRLVPGVGDTSKPVEVTAEYTD